MYVHQTTPNYLLAQELYLLALSSSIFYSTMCKKPASIITYSYYLKLVVVQRNMNKYKTKQRLSLKETQLYKFSKSVNLVHHSLNVISR